VDDALLITGAAAAATWLWYNVNQLLNPPDKTLTPPPQDTQTDSDPTPQAPPPNPRKDPEPKAPPQPEPKPDNPNCDDDKDEEECKYKIDEFHLFFPDTRSGNLQGFHHVTPEGRALEGIHYEWVNEPPEYEADYEPFTATFRIPNQPQWGTKTSSFFPMLLSDTQVLGLVGEAYVKSGCKPSGDWRATVTNPLINQSMAIEGGATNYFVKTAFPVF
jgi:hypothetical protein